ncbi:MAG: ADP-ribosylglycohydrolase family protein [Anaerolineales bacterium]|nr:ADP-ribosylglycohydrolase family protein [Anaerolineales bacterium]
MADEITQQDRYRGALLGLACGDAVGTTLEFKPPGSFAPISDMVGGGPFELEPGQWTDDTSMALCLAVSLVEQGGFDPADQMQRYVRWYREGYLSSNGVCFDIGNTVSAALRRFERSGEPYSGATDPYSAGNGSIMRLAPLPLAFAATPARAIALAAQSSRTTHGAPAALDGCRYFAGLILGALSGAAKHELLAPSFSPVPDLWLAEPLVPEIAGVAAGSFKDKLPPASHRSRFSRSGTGRAEIRGTGYVVESLEAALWAFFMSQNFADGCLLAANLGDDADTTAAVYGQLAGAYYGEQGIPAAWLAQLTMRQEITELADQLYALSQAGPAG